MLFTIHFIFPSDLFVLTANSTLRVTSTRTMAEVLVTFPMTGPTRTRTSILEEKKGGMSGDCYGKS